MKPKNYFCFILLLVFLSGCIVKPVAPSDFPYDLMLQPSDLPDGFTRTGGSFPKRAGAFSHIVGYSSDPEKIGKGISHQITIYPDTSMAKADYAKWEQEWLTPAWSEPKELYVPLNPNDLYKLKCMDVKINDENLKVAHIYNSITTLLY